MVTKTYQQNATYIKPFESNTGLTNKDLVIYGVTLLKLKRKALKLYFGESFYAAEH